MSFIKVSDLICFLGSQQFAEITREENVVFIDPIGAAIIGIYILVGWWQTGSGQYMVFSAYGINHRQVLSLLK